MNLDKVKQNLQAMEADIAGRIERTHKHIYQKDQAVSPNFSEQIKETENDTLVHALEAEGQQELRQIRQALARLDAGEYLDCATCGEAIGEERLQAIPYTDQCINCASRHES